MGITKFLLFITSVQFSTAQTTRPPCTFHNAGHSIVEIQTPKRTISVIGWDHPEWDGGFKKFADSHTTALNQAKEGQCERASSTLQKALQDIDYDVRNADFVIKALDSIDARNRVDVIGLERSPHDANLDVHFVFQGAEAILNQIIKNCPRIQNLAQRVRTVYYGPEFHFKTAHSHRNPPPAIFAYESDLERVIQFKTFEKQVTIDFDDLKSPHRGLPGYSEIQNALWDEQNPSEFAIKTLAKSMTGSPIENEATVRHDIGIWKERVRAAYLRNSAIIRNLDQVSGKNIAMVIGHRHVKDLVKQVVRKCNLENAPPKSPFASPVYPSFEATQ